MDTTTLSPQQTFNGDKKNLIHFLVPYEKKFLKAVLPWVPMQVSTAHLTLMTILWSMGVVIAGYFSVERYSLAMLVFNTCISNAVCYRHA